MTHWSCLESEILIKYITLFMWKQVILQQTVYQTYCSLYCVTIPD